MMVAKYPSQLFAISCFIGILTNSALAAVETYSDPVVQLRKDLFQSDKYYPLSPPSEKIPTVGMTLLIQHVYKLEESTGSLLVNGWLSASWDDHRLQWDPKSYSDVGFFQVPHGTIWIPDLTLYNNIEAMSMDQFGKTRIYILRSGTVFWLAPMTLKATCPITLEKYPFDEHVCTLSLGPWSHDSNEVLLKKLDIDPEHENEILSRFASENPEWELIRSEPEIVNKTYSCCPDTLYQSYDARLRLRRRAPFYKYVLVIPSTVATLLTLSVFWLSPGDQSKFTLGGFAGITEVILLTFLGWKIPPGGTSVPAIVIFCGNGLVMSVLSMIIAIIVAKLSHSPSTSQVPRPIRTLIHGPLGTCLCLHLPEGPLPVWSSLSYQAKTKVEEQFIDGARSEVENREAEDVSTKTSSVEDWYRMAMAIDRICFLVYCIVLAGILTSIFT